MDNYVTNYQQITKEYAAKMRQKAHANTRYLVSANQNKGQCRVILSQQPGHPGYAVTSRPWSGIGDIRDVRAICNIATFERLREEVRAKVNEFFVMCAWCKRDKLASGKWERRPHPAYPRTSHGMCPECFAEAKRQLKARKN